MKDHSFYSIEFKGFATALRNDPRISAERRAELIKLANSGYFDCDYFNNLPTCADLVRHG